MENEAIWNETEVNATEPEKDEVVANEAEINAAESEPIENGSEGTEAENSAEEEKSGIRKDFADRYHAAQNACKSTLERLAHDWKETGGNPYIRATSTFRYDIYRHAGDEEPIDTFVFERSNGCTLRALALATSLVAAVNLAVRKRFGK